MSNSIEQIKVIGQKDIVIMCEELARTYKLWAQRRLKKQGNRDINVERYSYYSGMYTAVGRILKKDFNLLTSMNTHFVDEVYEAALDCGLMSEPETAYGRII